MLALGDVNGNVFVFQPFEFKRNADAKRGGRAKIVVEFHGESINRNIAGRSLKVNRLRD
ncbi:hypothetical protein LP417_27275 [Polaromonas sp. P1-6]|nr:hypothetical protein LP417_27275 [Polaromonas sp. P1-6]